MMVSFKDGLKFIGISIVCFCAVFVCTFFLNYYIDILPLKDEGGLGGIQFFKLSDVF